MSDNSMEELLSRLYDSLTLNKLNQKNMLEIKKKLEKKKMNPDSKKELLSELDKAITLNKLNRKKMLEVKEIHIAN